VGQLKKRQIGWGILLKNANLGGAYLRSTLQKGGAFPMHKFTFFMTWSMAALLYISGELVSPA
jgi:hypothetical protein